MKRTTVMLPDDLDARVRREARRRGVSIADVTREALEQHLSAAPPRRLSFIGIADGEPSDVAARADEFVRAAIADRTRAEREC